MWSTELKEMHEKSQAASSIYSKIYDLKLIPKILAKKPEAIERVESFVAMSRTGFNLGEITSTVPRNFTTAELEMLLLAVSMFGFDDVKSIKAHCLYILT